MFIYWGDCCRESLECRGQGEIARKAPSLKRPFYELCAERLLGAPRALGLPVRASMNRMKRQPLWPNRWVSDSGQRTVLGKSLSFLLSQDLVTLKRSPKSQEENPCFLYLRCDPHGGEEIVSVGILSSARHMEVYLGEEYCGTSRGKNVCNVLENRFVPYPCASVLLKYVFIFIRVCVIY